MGRTPFAPNVQVQLLTLTARSMEAEELLREVSILRDLDEAALSHLASKLQPVTLPAGPVVTRGEPGDAMYMVKSGSASLVLQTSLRRSRWSAMC